MSLPTPPAPSVVLACTQPTDPSSKEDPPRGRALVVVSALVPSDTVARLEIDVPRRLAVWSASHVGPRDHAPVARPVRLHVRVINDARRRDQPAGELRESAIRPDESATRPDAASRTLTAREAEVLGWVGRGKTNRDVAAVLGLSSRTVQKHLEHIFQKLGVETRTAAVLAFGNPGPATE